MATTIAEINGVEGGAAQLYLNKVQELTSVITRWLPFLHRTALRHVGNVDDAQDVVQDALLSAYTHVDQFRGEAKMSSWLVSIVINCARMELRRRSPRPHIPLERRDADGLQLSEILSDSRPTPEEECRRAQRAKLLARSYTRLSPTLRHTFRLRDVHGLSIRETARLLGVPNGTVKARLARARARVRKQLQKSWQ